MIGLDIGSKYIKLCRIQKAGDGSYQVVSALMTGNPAGDDDTRQDGAVTARIKSLQREAGESGKTAALSVGGSQILARNFSFPQLSRQELEGAVQLEAQQSIFSDLSAMYADYQVVSAAGEGAMEVLYVAAPRQLVDRNMQCAQNAGLVTAIMDIDNFALANSFFAFDGNARNTSAVLLNIGHSHSNIAVIDNGSLRFVRNAGFGGRDITAEIARVLGTDLSAAEAIKINPDCWPAIGLNIKNILRRSMPDLIEAVYKSIEYCMNRKKLVSVDKIFVTGGSSALKGMDAFIADVLGIPCAQWDPLIASGSVSGSPSRGYFLSVALGLAVREMNYA